MESFDDVRTFWQKNTNQEANPSSLSKEDVEKVIKSRIKKEKKTVAEYFWVSLAFQILIYSFACYLFVRYWGNTEIIVLCAAGVLLYIPFTIILMWKFKSMYKPIAEHKGDIKANVRNQYELLTRFFGFKKRFDLSAIPVNSLVLTGVVFKLYVPGGIEAHLITGIAAFITMVLIFSIAAWLENKKHFINPLRQFKLILEDMEKNS
jgi:hypothetical protein